MSEKLNNVNKLVNWLELYLKNRDIILKKLVSIEKDNNILKANFKDKEQFFYVYLNPNLIDIELIKKNKFSSLVLLNSEANFSFILTSWSKLISIPNLSIYFVNPLSETDKKWIIFPYTHHQISEEESLAQGLRSLFESVEVIDEESFLQRFTT
jgi:hypothetical protein